VAEFSSDFSLAFWLHHNAGTFFQSIAYMGPNNSVANAVFNLAIATGPEIRFDAFNTSGEFLGPRAAITSSVFQHWSVTHKASTKTIKLYRNASEVDSVVYTGTHRNANSNFSIGARKTDVGFDRYLDARVDEFGWWNKTLESADVSQLFNSGSGLSYDNFTV
jgi:hypothetical protein